MINSQARRKSPNKRFVDVGAAFNQGLQIATRGGAVPTSNPGGSVKNVYENKLEGYLNNLPQDVDLTTIPDKYKNSIHSFLTTQKHNYVVLGRELSQQETGSDRYMYLQGQMTNIKNSFTNLSAKMKNYGEFKQKLVEDIRQQRTSLSPENIANVNLLQSVFTEQFDMVVDEYGNPSFAGDDGAISMDNLPGYELKAFGAAKNMLKASDAAYKAGVPLKPGNPTYELEKSKLALAIDEGGRNTLMSIISDGLIGNVKMIDDPYIAQSLEQYNNGGISFKGLRDIVVDNYMDVLSNVSSEGYKAKQVAASKRRGGGISNTQSSKYYSMVPMKNEFGEIKGYIRSSYDVSQPSLILTVEEYESGMQFDSPDRQQVQNENQTYGPTLENPKFDAPKTRSQAAKEIKEQDDKIKLPKLG